MRCPRCDGEDCIEIDIGLEDKDSVQFFSCRKCEQKWWKHEGGTVNLDEVLDLAARSDFR